MKATLLLQARTNSSRLPAKVLLPVGGVPLVVLAARRAANSGRRVVVVTSHESSDDVLCDVLENWNVAYYRGELENTLKRFVNALEGESDDHVVVRLTGDNVFPDGHFIDELLLDFEKRKVAYLCCGGEASGLPFGVSAEITRARYLREAHRKTDSAFDREHVTPWIIAKYGRNFFEYYRSLGMAQYRCTVDTLDDYLLVSKIFGDTGNHEQVPLKTLLEVLRRASTNVITSASASRMVLGAAQFGLNYGIANKTGRPPQALVDDLVRIAIANGVQYFDTARAYGESEQVLGCALSRGWGSRATVITKLSPLDDCPIDAGTDVVKAFVERSVYQSCHALGVSRLSVLMLHRAIHLVEWSGAVWGTLCQLKQQGVIGQLGVSVQSPDEALKALDFEDATFIQLPFNILDYRWDAVIKKVSEVRQHRPLTVHARSALLQGLLTTDHMGLWQRARCSNAVQVLEWLKVQAKEYANGSVTELCLRFALSQHWVDGVVIGVDTREHLVDNILKMGAECLNSAQLSQIIATRPRVPQETLNPVTWTQSNG